jgi:hypothetical protein
MCVRLTPQDSESAKKLWTVPVLFGTPKSGDKPTLELMKAKTHTIKVRLENSALDWLWAILLIVTELAQGKV